MCVSLEGVPSQQRGKGGSSTVAASVVVVDSPCQWREARTWDVSASELVDSFRH